jgi:hypothetical protein
MFHVSALRASIGYRGRVSMGAVRTPTLHEWQFYWRRWSLGWQSYPDNSIRSIHHLLIFVGPLQLWFYV